MSGAHVGTTLNREFQVYKPLNCLHYLLSEPAMQTPSPYLQGPVKMVASMMRCGYHPGSFLPSTAS